MTRTNLRKPPFTDKEHAEAEILRMQATVHQEHIEQLREEAARLYATGTPVRDIIYHCKISGRDVLAAALAHGIGPRPRGRRSPATEPIRRLYEATARMLSP